jgi:hypothetical protein
MKKIHALTIVDKSSSMEKFKNRTIEGINSSINTLKKEVDANTEIINTLLFFSGTNGNWSGGASTTEMDFIFNRVGVDVSTIAELTDKEYSPGGWTPLLDAIGYGVDKIKDFHGDKLGDDDLKIIVTIFTDGEENCSKKFKKDEIKKMIEHFQSDGKWTFTFVGCGSVDDVSNTSNALGISSSNTVAYAMTDAGNAEAYSKIGTSYRNFSTMTKSGKFDNDLFTAKS